MTKSLEIPSQEISIDNSSYVDPHGRLFKWNDGLYRAISPVKADFFKDLLGKPFFSKAVESGRIIQTEVTEYQLEGYGLVLSHRTVPVRSYCMEWPPEMLKKAAQLTLQLCLDALEENMCLQDAYPWNVLWEGTTPVFVDVGSFRPEEEEGQLIWGAYGQFCQFFLLPLYLYSEGLEEAVRPMLGNYLSGISFETCSKLLSFTAKFRPQIATRVQLPVMLSKLTSSEARKKEPVAQQPAERLHQMRRSFFKGLLRDVGSLKLAEANTTWVNYYERWPSWNNDSEFDAKQKTVDALLKKLSPESVLDVAANEGWYSILAAKRGARVVAVDNDEGCVARLYRHAQKEKVDVLPLVLNILNPTPAFGWNLVQFPSAFQRLKSDMVFAFALMHHLVISNWQSFPRVVELLKSVTGKWLLVEFVPLSDEKSQIILGHFKRDSFEWYTLENFKKVLGEHFSTVEEFESSPEGRVMLLCAL